LSEGKVYEAFDRQNGGGEKRLRFRLDGKAPCESGACKAETGEGNKPETRQEPKESPKESDKDVAKEAARDETRPAAKVEIVAKPAAADKVIATIDLTGRSASYCLNGVSRVDTTPAQRRAGCPPYYLLNFLAIRLTDGNGPFARRDVSIQYMYRPDAGAVSLDRCMQRPILDGMFRRRAWTVPLEDGAAVYIGEIDFPRDGRARVPWEPPFATTVFGAQGP
jgi:hypothetical protein